MRRSTLCLIGMLVLAGATPSSSLAQDANFVTAGSSIVESTAVTAGQLGGSVYDAASGKPIHRAWILAGSRGAFTDSAGVFLVSNVPPETTYATIEAVGYRKLEVELPDVSEDAGRVARIAMESSAVTFPCEGAFTYGVVVEVRDALTGQAPRGVVVLRARQDSLQGSDEATAEPEDQSLVLIARLGSQDFGPHGRPDASIDAEVTAEGYAPWTRTGIVIQPGRCGEGAKRFRVWLLPTASAQEATPSNKR